MPRMSPLLAQVYKNRGLDTAIVSRFEELEVRAVETIERILAPFPKASQVFKVISGDPEVGAHWEMADYMTVVKLGYNDHGETHAKIATAYALVILSLLLEAGIRPDLVMDGLGGVEDAFTVVTAATLLHDIGNLAGRLGHEALGVNLAFPILNRILSPIYPSVETRTMINACIAHAIRSHDLDPFPLTLEASIVAVGDGADLTEGRGRIAFDLGKVDIHSVSALAVKDVKIISGSEFPVEIHIEMSNSAGVFQVEQTLTRKVISTPLRDYVTVTAVVKPKQDEGAFERIYLRRGRFVTDRREERTDG